MYVRELPRHLPQQLPKREKKISSDYQVTICCVCVVVSIFQRTRKPNTKRKISFSGFVEAPPFFERSSKSTCKLVPSVPGFASAKLDIKKSRCNINNCIGKDSRKVGRNLGRILGKLYQMCCSGSRNQASAYVDSTVNFHNIVRIGKRPIRKHSTHFPHHLTDA